MSELRKRLGERRKGGAVVSVDPNIYGLAAKLLPLPYTVDDVQSLAEELQRAYEDWSENHGNPTD